MGHWLVADRDSKQPFSTDEALSTSLDTAFEQDHVIRWEVKADGKSGDHIMISHPRRQ
jgi:hypothetical protein